MHETHLIEPIIKGISKHARQEKARAVSRIHLKVGVLCGINEDSFRQTFSLLAKGTVAENAALEITIFPGSCVQVVSFDVE